MPTNNGRLQDRVIVVTGAGSGLGLAAVERFAAEGARVVGIDLRPDAALSAGASQVFSANVAAPDEALAIGEKIEAEIGPIEGLATFAGIESNGPLHETGYDAWFHVLNVNVLGTMNWVKAVLPGMRERQRGSVVLVASQLALAGGGNCVGYTTSKGAILSLARSLALDYAKEGIRVNALAPGACETPMLSRALATLPGDVGGRLRARHAMGRLGQAGEVAGAALYLLSDDASFVTGVTLPVDGGWLAA